MGNLDEPDTTLFSLIQHVAVCCDQRQGTAKPRRTTSYADQFFS